MFQTFHSLCHIAEVLLHHQQIGNVHYSGWRLEVPCCSRKEAELQDLSMVTESQLDEMKESIALARKETISKLQDLAKEMECQLDEWRECIDLARNKYYELNYYTTAQLLTLRRTLGSCKDNSIDLVVSSDVMALLQCIHPQVEQSMVKKAVCISLTNTMSLDMEESSDSFSRKIELSKSSSHECSSQESKIKLSSSQAPVKLTMSSLTERQKATVAYVMNRVKCSQNLVLKAFEVLDYENHQNHDYSRWCSLNGDLDISDDSEDSDSGSEIMEDIEEEFSEDEKPFTSGIFLLVYVDYQHVHSCPNFFVVQNYWRASGAS